jgi:hypothetical protein
MVVSEVRRRELRLTRMFFFLVELERGRLTDISEKSAKSWGGRGGGGVEDAMAEEERGR